MNEDISDTELISVPGFLRAELVGSRGANRSLAARPLIAATDDLSAIGIWLAEYRNSPHTLRSYRKEALRLLLWATRTQQKPVSSLNREDLISFEAFLSNPGASWGNLADRRVGRDYRIIQGPLSERSRRHAMGILSNLFSYLVSAGYLAANPLALRRQRRGSPSGSRRIERYLDSMLWNFVLESIERWQQESIRERQHYERCRWAIRFLYETALRAAEAARATASDFFRQRGRWWLRVTGKGGLEADVPVSDALMVEFARYRIFLGLPPVPSPTESNPIIMTIKGTTGQHLTPTAIYLMIKQVFHCAAELRKAVDLAGAEKLRKASTHWIRHTAASHQADAGTDLRFIQRNLRHVSIETTSIYLHAEEDRRHAQTTRQSPSSTG